MRWAYTWAANGMLRSVVRPDRKAVEFEYDALGRRTAKIFDDRVTRFVWDGNNPLHEWSYSVAERPQKVTDEFGFVSVVGVEPVFDVTTWVFEEGTFRPTAKITADEKFSIMTDYLGTPAQMYDRYGIKVWDCTLDIYGKVRTFEGTKYAPTTCDCPFRYQGQYEDKETGLYYNRFRYYAPDMGMYLSQDPIGLAGNNPTLYGYVFDTGLEVDVFGLAFKIVRTRVLTDGRVRYYGAEKSSSTPGPTRGANMVKEVTPDGRTRTWMESYDHSGKVNRVHPKSINGRAIDYPHYPPTAKDIDTGKAKRTKNGKGKRIKCR